MTEQELIARRDQLKAAYANSINTQKDLNLNNLTAAKQTYETNANKELATQQSATDTGRVDADINANNYAQQLRDLAARNGFSSGGEMVSGLEKNDKNMSNQVANLNSNFKAYKNGWQNDLNNYYNEFNNKVNQYNVSAQDDINNYFRNTDMDYADKITSLREAAAARAAAKAAAAAKVDAATTKTQLMEAYTYGVGEGTANYPATAEWLKNNQASLVKAGLWDTVSTDFAGKYGWVGVPMNDEQMKLQAYYNGTGTLTNKDGEEYSMNGAGTAQYRTNAGEGSGSDSANWFNDLLNYFGK